MYVTGIHQNYFFLTSVFLDRNTKSKGTKLQGFLTEFSEYLVLMFK